MASKFEIINNSEGKYHFTLVSIIDLFPEDVHQLRWGLKVKINKGFFSEKTNRYHYLAKQDRPLTPEQSYFIEKKGLKVILDQTQQEELEKQGANLDYLPTYRLPK